MALDPRRLRQDVDARRTDRPAAAGSGGRQRTGAMAVVRDHLADIETLRAEGARWGDIAAAMAAQGVTQGEGKPITERRLTALIASVRKQDAKRKSLSDSRSARPDIERPTNAAHGASTRLALSSELTAAPQPVVPASSREAEETLRRDSFERVQALCSHDADTAQDDT